MDSVDFLKILAGKLPPAIQHKWISRVGVICDVEHRDTSHLDLAIFVSQEVRNPNDPHAERPGYQCSLQGSNQHKGKLLQRTGMLQNPLEITLTRGMVNSPVTQNP